jgi:hypothetical protein
MPFPSPTLAPPALGLYQMSYGGLTFGGIAAGGSSPYQLQTLDLDMPDIATGDVQRAIDQGEFVGTDVLPGRDITIVQVVRAVAAGFNPGPTMLPVLANGVLDPSFEYDREGSPPGGGWTTYGTNILDVLNAADAGAGAYVGSLMCELAYGSDLRLAQAQTTAYVPGESRTISAFVWIPAGWNGGQIVLDNEYMTGSGSSNQASGANMTLTNQWQRIHTVVNAGAVGFYGGVCVRAASAPTSGPQYILLDAVMETAGTILAPYGDGDSSGWYWTGTPGDSTSSNAPRTPSITPVTVDQAAQALGGVLGPGGVTEAPLYISLPSGTFACMARPRKHNCPLDLNRVMAKATIATTLLHATDPRFYAAPSRTATVGLPTPAGGLLFPVTFPASFGGGGAGGLVTVVNAGRFEMRPVFIVTGPCTNPTITNLSIAGAPAVTFALSLSAGDTLVIDSDWRTAIYTTAGSTQGASRRNALTSNSTWFNLPPGANIIEFTTSDGMQVAGTLTVQSADAYLSL